MASAKPPPRSQIWADICCTLYFSNENPWVSLTLIYFTIFSFLLFDRRRYFGATNNCTRRFTRHNLFDANWHTLVKRCGCFFFHQGKNGLAKTFSAGANTTWYLSSKWQSASISHRYSDQSCLFHLIINNTRGSGQTTTTLQGFRPS